MAYDDARGVTVLFGGYDGTTLRDDTWQWDGNAWTQLAVSGPEPRVAHAMAYDLARQVAVLFGGVTTGVPYLGDTWILNTLSPLDTNCDGSINVLDIQSFVDLLIGVGNACSECAGDANSDGAVDGLDIQAFVEFLMG
jgi:hypothetical protein